MKHIETETAFEPARLLAVLDAGTAPAVAAEGLRWTISADPWLPSRIVADERKLQVMLSSLIECSLRGADQGTIALDATPVFDGRQLWIRFTLTNPGGAALSGAARHLARQLHGFVEVETDATGEARFVFVAPVSLVE